METQQKKLHQLFFPIFFEILFTMLAGAVDTFMLSTEGDHAVGAVGTANTYIGVFLIMFNIISSGVMAVMTQYIGASRPGVARQALRLGLIFNLFMGLGFTALLYFGAEPILVAIGIAQQLLEPAKVYMQVIGLFCICNALTPVLSSYLRAFGHTAPTMTATITANLANLLLNALFLFVFHWGVWGVALATGISRVVNLLWLVVASRRRIHVAPDTNPPANGRIFRQIVKIGLPAALESVLYNLAITLVIGFLNQMDSDGLQATARSYAAQICHFAYCAGAALAFANSIRVGWHIGSGDLEECDRSTGRVALLGITVGSGTAALLALFGEPIISLFTDDPEMIRLVCILLIIDIPLEVGRATNLIYGNALKISGDALFPMVIAVVFAFLCAAGGTWFFGIRLGWLAVGAYVAMALDECVRAVCMFTRWRTGTWKKHIMVK